MTHDVDRSIFVRPTTPTGDDFLPTDELRTLTSAELIRRTTALAPLVAAHAADAERLRRPHDVVWSALRGTGYFYQFVPGRYGGVATDFDAFADATLPIAEADPATAWVAIFCAGHNKMLAYFPEEARREFWGDGGRYVIAPSISTPPGRAERLQNGFRVTGAWKWGTGIMHADWVLAMALVEGADGQPQPWLFAFPAADATVVDTWFMDGLAGTGSNDIRVDGLFVPDHRATPMMPMILGSGLDRASFPEPVFSAPLVSFNAATVSLTALGAARACLRIVRERLDGRIRQGGSTKQVDRPAMQIRLAEADLKIGAAELLIRDNGRRAFSLGSVADDIAVAERIAVRARSAYACALCLEAVQHLAVGAGASIHASDQPFQRLQRDLGVMCGHVGIETDGAYEQHGRSLLSLAPTSMIY